MFNPLGNAFLREGMTRMGAAVRWTFQALALLFWRAFQSDAVWIGVILLMSFLISNMRAFLGRLQLRSACLCHQLYGRGVFRLVGFG
jgi:hypothetical protein